MMQLVPAPLDLAPTLPLRHAHRRALGRLDWRILLPHGVAGLQDLPLRRWGDRRVLGVGVGLVGHIS